MVINFWDVLKGILSGFVGYAVEFFIVFPIGFFMGQWWKKLG